MNVIITFGILSFFDKIYVEFRIFDWIIIFILSIVNTLH